MPVVDKKVFDMSHTWPIVSRLIAAVLGGFMVTYWTGAAVTKTAIQWELLGRADAAMISGFAQLVMYVSIILWVFGTASIRKAWVVLVLLAALLVGISEFTPGPHRWRTGWMGQDAGAAQLSGLAANGNRDHTR